MIKFMYRMYYRLLSVRYLFRLESASESRISVWKKLFCLIHGFSSDKYDLYKFNENDYRRYLSDVSRFMTIMINGKYAVLINDKFLYSQVYSCRGSVPLTYSVIKSGCLDNSDSLADIVKRYDKVIIKPKEGGGGKDIHVCELRDNKLVYDGRYGSEEWVLGELDKAKEYIVSEFVKQMDYSNRIFPYAVNSIRIITMRDPITNKVFISLAVHKFGSNKTGSADNVWRGGLTAMVNLETGILGKAALHSNANRNIRWIDRHPDSKEAIQGVCIPNWERVKEDVIKMASIYTEIRYAGWDVVPTEKGIKVIEGNNYSDVNILQIHEPLLDSSRAREFYRYYRII